MSTVQGRDLIPEFSAVPGAQWNDPWWQLHHRIVIYGGETRHAKKRKIQRLLGWLSDTRICADELLELAGLWAISVTPHWANQLVRVRESGRADWYQQMLRYTLPRQEQRDKSTLHDFAREGMGTEHRRGSAYPGLPYPVTRLYDSRIVIATTSMCAIYCQACFRQSSVAGHLENEKRLRNEHERTLEYVRKWNRDNPSRKITDVILSGGDPSTIDDDRLVSLIRDYKNIEGVEILRIDMKPTAIPQRITGEFGRRLREYRPLIVIFHLTHPGELCFELRKASDNLALNGIMLRSHTPLWRGVNDNRETLVALFDGAYKMGVMPLYLIQHIDTPGAAHARVPVERGKELIKYLEPDLAGPAHPHYIIYMTAGGGKIHVQPQYLTERTPDGWWVDTWLGRQFFPDPVS